MSLGRISNAAFVKNYSLESYFFFLKSHHLFRFQYQNAWLFKGML